MVTYKVVFFVERRYFLFYFYVKVNILSILYFDLSNIKTIYFVLLLKMLFLFCRYYISAISQSSEGSFNLESLAFKRFLQSFFSCRHTYKLFR